MNTWRNDIALVSDNKSEEKVEQNTDREVDMEDLKCILLFTSELLKSSINKEVYNSTEVSLLVQYICMYSCILYLVGILYEYSYYYVLYLHIKMYTNFN